MNRNAKPNGTMRLDALAIDREAYQRWVWAPGNRLATYLDPDFFHQRLGTSLEIPLACRTDANGNRRWYADCWSTALNADDFIARCFIGGLAILQHDYGLVGDRLASYRTMWLLFSRRRRFREYFGRRFQYRKDLEIPGKSSLKSEFETVFQFKVGDSDWNATRLYSVGRQIATERGENQPTEKRIIQLGLREFAEEHPQALNPQEIPGLVRSALFETTLEDDFVSEVLDHPLVPRLLEALWQHVDDSEEAFEEWFTNMRKRGFKHLARGRKSDGGVAITDDPKKVVLALIWRAYEYVAQCIEVQMQAVAEAIDPPLTVDERRIFSRMHHRQSELGGLPWILLSNRMSFISPEVQRIWDSPQDPHDPGVLHTMLALYALMASSRKELDVQLKRAKSHVSIQAFDRCSDDSCEVGQSLIDAQNITCRKCRGRSLRIQDYQCMGRQFAIDFACVDCDSLTKIPIDSNRLIELTTAFRN